MNPLHALNAGIRRNEKERKRERERERERERGREGIKKETYQPRERVVHLVVQQSRFYESANGVRGNARMLEKGSAASVERDFLDFPCRLRLGYRQMETFNL